MTEHFYTYAEHRFRFASWAAIGAVNRKMSSPVCKTNGKPAEGELTNIIMGIFEEIGFSEITGRDYWLLEINNFDIQHGLWREHICELAKEREITHGEKYIHKKLRKVGGKIREEEGVSHGLAAKLINVFIKALMPTNMYSISPELRERWNNVHPPIDSIILENMDEVEFGGKKDWGKVRWTKLKSGEYEELINNIRYHDKPNPLWKIERYWKP